MNLCNFCIWYNRKKHCCEHKDLVSFLGVQIPTGIKIFHCDLFCQSDNVGDVTIRCGDGKIVSYNYNKIKFNKKVINL